MRYKRRSPKSHSTYKPQTNPMDSYRQPPARHDEYRTRREHDNPTQFVNRDSGQNYERAIERTQRALQNYENKSERERKKDNDTEQKSEPTDILEQLDRGDWRNMDPDTMSRFFTEQGENFSKSERTEFLDLLMEKMMKESEQQQELIDTDIEIIKTGSEMKAELEHLKSTTENNMPTETQTEIEKHGRELEPQSDGPNQDDLRAPEALVNLDQEETATVDIETPLQSAAEAASEIASNLENQGFERISEVQQPASNVESQFAALESELDSNPLAQSEATQTVDLETQVDLSTAPEIVQPLNAELRQKTLNAEASSEIGDGEFG